MTLEIGPGEAWALATPAGLQAAADGAALDPADLLPVRCSALADGSFIANSEPFAALDLLGLSINGCPTSALALRSGRRLLLSNTHLKGSNAKDLAEDGGAALLAEIDEVMLVSSACIGNYVLYNGGCIKGQQLGQFKAVNSSFNSNWKSAEEVGGRLKGGGALYFELLGPVTISNCCFAHNSALYGSGGALFCSSCGDVLVTNSRFANNSAADSGGCIYAGEVASLTVTNCTFTANGQLPGTPDIWTASGAAIATDGTRTSDVHPVNLILRGSTLVGNAADVGGAVFALQYSNAKGRVEVHECRFVNNTGHVEAGAIMIEENQYTELVLNASRFEGNAGQYGGAVSAYDADVVATDCSFTGNKADTDGGALHLFTMQAAGSGNQLTLAGCRFADNAAGMYGGAVAVYHQGLAVRGSTFEANQGGSAGGVYLNNAPAAALLDSVFERNIAELGTAGAVRLAAVGQLEMRGITMKANEAWGGNGGAMQAAQVSGAVLSGLTVTDGYASAAGGGFSFLDCANVTLQGSTFFNNTAPLGAGLAAESSQLSLQAVNISGNVAAEEEVAEEDGRRRRLHQAAAADASNVKQFGSEVYASTTGGALLVQQTSLSLADSTMAGNTAGGDAGALFVQAPTGLEITNVTFADNTAETGVGAAVVVRGAGAAVAAGVKGCNFTGNAAKLGNGGAVLMDSGLGPLEVACEGCNFQGNKAAAASIAANSITGNRGSTGGALFASADCGALAGGCRMGQVNVTDLTAHDNSATEAGGVLYTTTPAAVNVGVAGQDPESASAEQRREQVVQQLSQSNTVEDAGYGPAVASFPTQLSLMYPVQDDFIIAAFEAQPSAQIALQQPEQQAAGRKLQQVPLPPMGGSADSVTGARTDFQRQVDNTYQISSTPGSGTSEALQPFCPALGATIVGQHIMSIGSNQNFSVPISVLDAFGSKARSGPGSNWIVALSQASGDAWQLSGSLRGALSGGYVVLQGLNIQAEPGSRLNLTLSAVPPPGSGDKPLSASIDVLVRPCVAGEYASSSHDNNLPGQRSGASSISCRTCAAPMFSFSAYAAEGAAAAANETVACQSCPAMGVCVAGMVIPESGAFQVHPRSTVIRRCPNLRACERNSTAMLNLQGLQCAQRRYIDPADIDPRPYTAMQCSNGYAGPLCSSCYRPGRNMWLLQQLNRSGQQEPGFTLGDQVVIATGQAGVTAGRSDVYGESNGRCQRCPHMVLSWVGFLLSRALDLLVIALIALLWVFYGWLSHSAAATAFVRLKRQRTCDLKMWDSIFGAVAPSRSGLALTRSLSHALSAAAAGGGVPARHGSNMSSEVERGARPKYHGEQRESGPGQHGDPPAEHMPVQVQPSVVQPVSGGPAAQEVPKDSTVVPPPPAAAACTAGTGALQRQISPFSLVEQPSVQPAVASEPSAGSFLQGVASRHNSGGLYHIYRSPSMRWSSAVDVVNLLKQQYLQEGFRHVVQQQQQQLRLDDDVLAQQAALMLMAVKHLACLAQVVLDGAQIAAVLLSLDLLFLVPDWAAKGLAGAVLTQAHTWQYVPFECLISGRSESSAALAQTVLVALLPIIYTLVLSPTLLWLLDLSKDSALFRQYVLAGTAAPAASEDLPAQSQTAAPGVAPPAANPCSSWFLRFWPTKSGTWTLFAAIAVASMAYCYSFYVANITAAFSCMSLSTTQTVLGEYQVTRSVWVPDMQLSCGSPPQVAAMAVAILIGIPVLVGYWLLLLTLAWPKQAASPAPVPVSKATSRGLHALSVFWQLIKRACIVPFAWLERPVRTCQRYTSAIGVSGESCAALSVWNVEWRWWWLVGREVMKFGLVAAAALTTMRGPDEQARVLLLLVVVAAAISWRAQAGCSTSMNQLQFVVWCWLQLLALLVVIPSMQGVGAVGFGSAVLVLVGLVMLQCALVFGCLVWRITKCCRNLSLLMQLESGALMPLASVAELM
ncbi:hypothetical protein COO60DRAFT_1624944, partial [Scenedesmus sp. NREL 46B-D3]